MTVLDVLNAILAVVFIGSPLGLLFSALGNKRKTNRDFEEGKPKVKGG